MTISKKLSITFVLALGTLFTSQAMADIDAPYGQNGTRFPLTIFALKLEQKYSDSVEGKKIALWLYTITQNPYSISDREMDDIIDIINSSELSVESKIAIFSRKIKNDEESKKLKKNFDAMAATAMFAGIIVLTALTILEDTKNPHPVLYVPTISITWTKKYSSWPYSQTYTWPWYY